MNWKQFDEPEQPPKVSRPWWRQYRKWLLVLGVIPAIFLIFQIQTGLEIMRYGHVCYLPKPGDSFVVYEGVYEDGRTPQRTLWVLDANEKVPLTSTQLNAESEKEYSYAARMEDGDGYITLDTKWGRHAPIICEVECVHVADTLCEANWSDDPVEKDIFTLAEYRVIRVLAEFPYGKGKVKEGKLITTFGYGNSTIRYFENEPYKAGDRFVLSITPMENMYFVGPAALCTYGSDFYIEEKLKLYADENTGGYTLEKPVRLGKLKANGDVEIVREMDPERSIVDQLGELAQENIASLYEGE